MTLDNILDAIYEAECESYNHWLAHPDDVKHHPLIFKPALPVRHVVMQQWWNMRGVVTGSRRKWKRGA